ncbi:MAG TPA: hypothetical protein VFG39_02705, partial [Balneolaceae bacterium]|nr:hypothetical protein [Balneolaceae bacterium]
MKCLFKMVKPRGYVLFLILLSVGYLTACTGIGGVGALGELPKADFSIAQGNTPNEVVVINKTNMTSIPYWSTSNGLKAKGDTAVFHFTFKGTYTITLAAAGNGGIDSTSKKTTIEQNDPNACQGTVRGFIAGCSDKTWKLNPAAYAEMVGPAAGDGSWFGNSAASVTGLRACDFNDTWTFSFDAEGSMKYDNKGDFFADTYIGNANSVCGVNSDLSATQKPWASGNFNYKVIPNSGVKDLGQLKVIGLGAHIGFPKAVNGAENTEAPVESITYDI